jgi:hypothetical protein
MFLIRSRHPLRLFFTRATSSRPTSKRAAEEDKICPCTRANSSCSTSSHCVTIHVVPTAQLRALVQEKQSDSISCVNTRITSHVN